MEQKEKNFGEKFNVQNIKERKSDYCNCYKKKKKKDEEFEKPRKICVA